MTIAQASVPHDDRHKRNHLSDGAWAEMIAIAWLLEQGFSVFKNVSGFGPVDIVGLKDGETHLFDVKTCSSAGHKVLGGSALKPKQILAGVKQLFVTPDGLCGFSRQEISAKLSVIHSDLPKGKPGFLR